MSLLSIFTGAVRSYKEFSKSKDKDLQSEVGSILINSFNDKPGEKEFIRSRNEARKRALAENVELKKLNALHAATPAPSDDEEIEDSESSSGSGSGSGSESGSESGTGSGSGSEED